MISVELNKKVRHGTKWSFIAEVSSKLMIPITTMVLARILTPEMFGIVTTIVMIISFAEMIADSGFQKFLVQREFFTIEEKEECTNVAFWTNLFIAFTMWGLIVIFSEQLASLVGNPGFGHVISIAGISLPLTAFSSIQMALLKRDFDFKSIFYVRLIGDFIPIFITIPLAFIFNNYWALIIGTIATNISNVIIFTIRSKWKPKLLYDFKVLKKMFSFSSWSLVEEITIWSTLYIGTFLVSSFLSLYYLGIYRNSMGIVNQIMAIIAGATMPIVFSTLSRLQDQPGKIIYVFLKFQRLVAIFVLPLGVGIFMYRDILTYLLLGNQWNEASEFIGLWGLMSSLTIVFGYLSSELYRALGKPKLSVLAQVLYLLFLIPVLIITSQISFSALYIARSLLIVVSIFIDMFFVWFAIKINPIKLLSNVFPLIISSCLMGLFAFGLRQLSQNIYLVIVSIVLCIIFYFSIIMIFKNIRHELIKVIKPFLKLDIKVFNRSKTLEKN
ncbi:lipopolysaccharide biosynthesis protein [Lysinibacillus sp. PLM2]|nr:lipopolysaccharide biosynthesis protein [Lysinibacillus sp. PLM2]